MNAGMVGFGSENSRGTFDNMAVQILPPKTTYDHFEEFTDGETGIFGGRETGDWSIDPSYGTSVYAVSVPSGAGPAVSLADIGTGAGVDIGSVLQIDASLTAVGGTAGIVYDRY